MNKKSWYYISLAALLLSVASLFLPVVHYLPKNAAQALHFNIIGLMNGQRFLDLVLADYRGYLMLGVSDGAAVFFTVALSILGAAAIILAFIGINSMVKQYASSRPFHLAMVGLIGTMIPSVSLLVLYFMSKNYFLGRITLGAYVFITPIAMILACLTVSRRHRLTQDQLKLQKQAQAYLHPAGDLPPIR